MKPRKFFGLFAATSIIFLARNSEAGDGIWNTSTNSQSWSTNTNWVGNTIADGSGSTANFNTLNIAGDITVNLDGARTIGNLLFGDTDISTAAGWIIATGSGGPLTLAGSTPTITVNALASGRFATIDAVLAGTNGFVKDGNGALRLRNASNTISGPVVVSAGTLQLAVAALTNVTSVSLDGGTLVNATGAANVIGGTISFGGGTLQYNNNPGTDYSSQFSTAANQQYRINLIADRTATYSTNLSSEGGTLTKLNAGTLILAAANTFSGATTISGGTLQLNNALALQNSTIDTTASATGTLVLNSVTSPTFGGLTGDKALASLFNATAGNYASVTNITLNSGTGANLTYSGAIANGRAEIDGGMTLTKTGAGRQVLAVSNTYTGGTIMNAGTLNYGHANALSTGDVTFIGGSILQAGVATTLANNISVNTGITGTVGTAGFATTLSGAITGDGTLAKGGGGTLTLTGGLANTISGGFRVASGILEVLDGLSLTNAGSVTVLTGGSLNYSKNFASGNNLTNNLTLSGNGAGGLGALNLRGNVDAIGAITLAADATITHDFNNATISGSITGTNRNLTLATINSAQPGLVVSGEINLGTGGLTINSAGGSNIVTLTANNSYSGNTVVNTGTLFVNNSGGSGTGSGAVTISTGATLAGSGSVSGEVTVAGILSPGNSIESLGTGSLTFINGSLFDFEVNTNSANADLIYITGDLNIGSNVTINLTDLAATSDLLDIGTKFTLISYTGDWDNGTFDGYANNSTFSFANNTWLINYNDISGGSNFSEDQTSANGFVTLTVVPESSTIFLVILGISSLLAQRNRALDTI